MGCISCLNVIVYRYSHYVQATKLNIRTNFERLPQSEKLILLQEADFEKFKYRDICPKSCKSRPAFLVEVFVSMNLDASGSLGLPSSEISPFASDNNG